MTVKELDSAMSESLDQLSLGIKAVLNDEYSKNPASEGDVIEIAKQTFYTLAEFKDQIINYLSSQ